MPGPDYLDEVSDQFHRVLRAHNHDEPALIRSSGILIGRDARVLAHGLRIQAYNAPVNTPGTYNFETPVAPKASYGFIDGRKVVREVYWPEGHPGVALVDEGTAVAIPARVTRENP